MCFTILYQFQHQRKQRLVLECCDGYVRTENKTHCEPHCSSPSCSKHGVCVRPDTCLCHSGYGGADCSKCKREGGRSQVTISYFLSQFARRGGGARTVPGSVSVPVAGSVTPTRAPARVPPAGSGPSVTQSVPRAPSAWTVQISAPVITMAR